ncbi:MAG: hypothetical protein HOI85_03395 [Euryarchaeota archaeon]|jgi:hypothetical protein|nr:hypothetical protein [Euryarchaeota archaeon]MBT6255163.1 hypothetical protein [Euryarchaeota archaeon]MBT6527380.1 hypothetical protein [Euryarchaeota archaeon]
MDRARLNTILWPIALLLVNSLWGGISDNAAPYEINDYDHAIEDRTVTLGGVFGQDKSMPSTFEFEFEALSVDDGSIGWEIIDNQGQVVAQWAGELGDAMPDWNGELMPGTYIVKTNADPGILTQQTLYIQPFAAYSLEGHILLSSMLILFAVGETIVRKKGGEYFAKKKANAPKSSTQVPFSRMRVGMPEDDLALLEDSPWRTPKGL